MKTSKNMQKKENTYETWKNVENSWLASFQFVKLWDSPAEAGVHSFTPNDGQTGTVYGLEVFAGGENRRENRGWVGFAFLYVFVL